MRSDGLSAADWQVVNKYIDVLRPLRSAQNALKDAGKAAIRTIKWLAKHLEDSALLLRLFLYLITYLEY
jgi:hypothetical protein